MTLLTMILPPVLNAAVNLVGLAAAALLLLTPLRTKLLGLR